MKPQRDTDNLTADDADSADSLRNPRNPRHPRLKTPCSPVVKTAGVLRHSPWDALLIGLAMLHGALLLLVPSVPLVAIGLWWNANTVSHNFIHLPFLRSR